MHHGWMDELPARSRSFFRCAWSSAILSIAASGTFLSLLNSDFRLTTRVVISKKTPGVRRWEGRPSRPPPLLWHLASDHRLESLAFIIPFLNPFCCFFYAVRHVSGQHRRAPMLMLVVSLKLTAACCFRVCVQLCDLTTCIHLRPCTIASAPNFPLLVCFLHDVSSMVIDIHG